jgi:hypothetical protein
MTQRLYRLGVALSVCIVIAVGIVATGDDVQPPPQPESPAESVRDAAVGVDRALQGAWTQAGVDSLEPADPLTIVRRLSLALCGTVPSLEEIRAIEKLPAAEQADAHLERLLADRRFADYFAERLARAFVGTDNGPFIIYRRRRFVYWLSDELAKNRPYDDLAREIIGAQGLWTDQPATNFVTAHFIPDQGPDPAAMAARTTRAFLGMRIDCAQCHDHPFAEWKQGDFEGLAAFFGQVRNSLTGITDKGGEYEVEDIRTKEKRTVGPRVPFSADSASDEGRRREQLARWITDTSNPYFAKAIANRVWTLMFGQGIVEPVDDLEAEPRVDGVLDMLAGDFRSSGHDLRRLIRVIASTGAFRASSAASGGREVSEAQEKLFAAFPVSRLRSEQIAGALIQASSLRTVDAESHILVRFFRTINTGDFVNRYGDAGEEELNAHIGTIPQRLVMMNGQMPRERIEASPLNAAGRIATLAPNDDTRVEVAYLVCMSRRPTSEEKTHFVSRLSGLTGDNRNDAVEDMLWALVNSTEFSWNH